MCGVASDRARAAALLDHAAAQAAARVKDGRVAVVQPPVIHPPALGQHDRGRKAAGRQRIEQRAADGLGLRMPLQCPAVGVHYRHRPGPTAPVRRCAQASTRSSAGNVNITPKLAPATGWRRRQGSG